MQPPLDANCEGGGVETCTGITVFDDSDIGEIAAGSTIEAPTLYLFVMDDEEHSLPFNVELSNPAFEARQITEDTMYFAEIIPSGPVQSGDTALVTITLPQRDCQFQFTFKYTGGLG